MTDWNRDRSKFHPAFSRTDDRPSVVQSCECHTLLPDWIRPISKTLAGVPITVRTNGGTLPYLEVYQPDAAATEQGAAITATAASGGE